MGEFSWKCPYCNHDTVIGDSNISENYNGLKINNIHGDMKAITKFIVCPNPSCNEVALYLHLVEAKYNHNYQMWGQDSKEIKIWTLMPSSEAKVFPDYIPNAIINDYTEACLIKETSPKASATLSRRCLQGIIRDFWGVSKSRLIDEIDAIKDKIDPLTWEAIDAVRKIGNIGAHMERDINQIIDVDSSEASLLIQLIETLINDWYISRHERQERLKKIVDIKTKKDLEKKSK